MAIKLGELNIWYQQLVSFFFLNFCGGCVGPNFPVDGHISCFDTVFKLLSREWEGKWVMHSKAMYLLLNKDLDSITCYCFI